MSEKVQEAMERLEQGLESLVNQEDWQKFLQFKSKMHGYSFNNSLMILIQCPEATRVAGFQTWKSLGRHVKKGEKGIAIFAPNLRKVRKKEDDAERDVDDTHLDAGETKLELYGYRITYIFDVTQTEGEPLPDVPAKYLELQGGDGLSARLLVACPFPVHEKRDEDIEDGVQGYWSHRTNDITLRESLSEADKTRVLVHEWAHGLLHGFHQARPPQYVRELEADSTAFVVCSTLGFDIGASSFQYITMYAGEKAIETLRATMMRIQNAANTILSSLESKELSEAV